MGEERIKYRIVWQSKTNSEKFDYELKSFITEAVAKQIAEIVQRIFENPTKLQFKGIDGEWENIEDWEE